MFGIQTFWSLEFNKQNKFQVLCFLWFSYFNQIEYVFFVNIAIYIFVNMI